MLRFEDLMAAHLLSREQPDSKQTLLKHLEKRKDRGLRISLLSSLVDAEVISMDQASSVHAHVERYKREQALAVYSRTLCAEGGLSTEQIEPFLASHDPNTGDLGALANCLITMGILSAEEEQALRYRARKALDRHLAKLCGHYTMNLQLAFKVEGGDSPGLSSDPRTTSKTIVDQNLDASDAELPLPKFAIPTWIDTSDARAGSTIGDYHVLGRVGAGAMGCVYLAMKVDDRQQPVAVKVLRDDASDEARGRFKREILANASFAHPNVLDIYDAGQTEAGEHFLAMEFFDGASLGQILEEDTHLAPRRALEIAVQVLSALHGCHQSEIVHRDVKPDNILVARESVAVKLMDFGIALIGVGEFEDKMFHTGHGEGVSGTPAYVSPEQAAGYPLEASSDVYSMGIVLYEMLTGRLPFESDTAIGFLNCHILEDPCPMMEADPATRSLPLEVHALVAKMIDKDPDNRPSAQEAAQGLEAAQLELTSTGRVRRRSATSRARGRRRMVQLSPTSANLALKLLATHRTDISKQDLDALLHKATQQRVSLESLLSDRVEGGALTKLLRIRERHGRSCEKCMRRTYLLPTQTADNTPCEHCGGQLGAS